MPSRSGGKAYLSERSDEDTVTSGSTIEVETNEEWVQCAETSEATVNERVRQSGGYLRGVGPRQKDTVTSGYTIEEDTIKEWAQSKREL